MQANFSHFLFTIYRLSGLRESNAISSEGLTATCAIHFALRCRGVITCRVVMADIVLTTLNAKYIHAAFGLRYLLANLGPLKSSACLLEFDINQRPFDIVETLIASSPKIIGFGVYIWNVTETTEVIAAIKRITRGLGHHRAAEVPAGLHGRSVAAVAAEARGVALERARSERLGAGLVEVAQRRGHPPARRRGGS